MAARKRNFPSKANIKKKEELKQRGVATFTERHAVSKLEQKLRKKLTFILSEIDGDGRKPKRKSRPCEEEKPREGMLLPRKATEAR